MLFHAKHTAVLLLGLVLVAVVAVACSEPSTDGNSIRDLEEAIKLNPQDPDNYNKRGMLYHELGQYNRAITDFDEAIRLTVKMSVMGRCFPIIRHLFTEPLVN